MSKIPPHQDDARETLYAVFHAAVQDKARTPTEHKALHDLGWDRIVEALSQRCVTEDGAALAARLGLLPIDGPVVRRRAEILELAELIRVDDMPPLRGVRSIGVALTRARKEDVLDGELLLAIASTAESTRLVRAYAMRREATCPTLAQHASRLEDTPELIAMIRRAFDPSGALTDAASPNLGRLRRRVVSLRTEISDRLDRIVKSPRYEGILQGDYVTFRNERFVIPVRSGERGDFAGIVHAHSGSGATLFIEPQEIIPLNNAFHLAQVEVEEEIRRILEGLTRHVASHADALEENQDIATYLDLTLAAARLTNDLEMSGPTLVPASAGATLDLRRARHPVLALRELEGELVVVPNDIRVPDGAHVLVISGPNTGGKTVTLKTLGLFALMSRAGLPVPCDPDSTMPLFVDVFSDIGDEQTVEKDLSTFSGHVRNIASFLVDCDARSLVLLDELFAGTDPEQGAALGRALLDELAQRRSWVVTTTHLETLKTLAFEDERYACASVGFDVDKLEPTYRLRAGVPGSSYALRIASRLGLSARVVERAETLLRGGESEVREDLLLRLEREYVRLTEDREATESERAQLKRQSEALEAKKRSLVGKDRELVDAESKRLRDEIRDLRARVKDLTRTLDRSRTATDDVPDEALRKKIAEAREVAKEVERSQRAYDEQRRADAVRGRRPARFADLAVGVQVYVRPFARSGTVVEAPEPNARVAVQLGAMRASFALDELHLEASDGEGATAPSMRRSAAIPVSDRDPERTLDLRGSTVDDALEQLDAFVDRAMRARLYRVVVVHGHGTGALKRAVRDALRRHPSGVASRPGERGEGGDGVTIVDLDAPETPATA